MSPEAICQHLQQRFGSHVVATAADSAHPHVVVEPAGWSEVARHLRDEPTLAFNLLRCVTAKDLLADNLLCAVYDLMAIAPPDDPRSDNYSKLLHEFAIHVRCDRDDPRMPSAADVWPAADWHEREAYDMMGIIFEGHPDSVSDHDGTHPRRILCPDDWDGFPLRKDYRFPLEYHGIPMTTEYQLTSPRH